LKKAIVFLNMGAPRNLDEVEVFLKNMFMDKNIITVKSDLLRWLIANMIVFTRKKEAKKNYALLGGASPLVEHTKNFLLKVEENFSSYKVINIMRYTPLFATDGLKQLLHDKVEELVVIPLYPQYSTTTTKSSLEDFHEGLKKLNYTPKIKIIDRFYKDINYNKAIIKNIKAKLENQDSQKFDLIFSAHSLPQKIVDSGDPYQKEVEENVEILKSMLKEENIEFKNIHLAYQSKLGPVKWLEPSFEDKLKSLENRKVIIYPLSFILDNSETEFELSIEYKDIASDLGFEEYLVCSCINNSDDFIQFIGAQL